MSLLSKLRSGLKIGRMQKKNSSYSSASIAGLEKRLGYFFKDKKLLELALTHPSSNLNDNQAPNNQRLEFLGDSILGAVLSSELFSLFPEENEGSLSRKRSFFARGSHLAQLGLRMGLEECIKMSPAEIRNKGNQRSSTIEDAVESVVGAIYLDGGFEVTRSCILNWIGDLNLRLRNRSRPLNPKGKLQEIVQAKEKKQRIRYDLLKQTGPDHAKSFLIEVCIGEETIARGEGRSKKEAESNAAVEAIRKLEK